MNPPEAISSRCCFCIFSAGDPKKSIQDNHKTILHPLWKSDHFYVEAEGEKKLSFFRVLWSAMAYPLGMIGYLVDTALKLVLLIGNFFVFLISLCKCDPKWRHERGVILLDTLLSVGIGLIGIVAPPAAYRLEECANEKMLALLDKSLPRGRSRGIYYMSADTDSSEPVSETTQLLEEK